MATVYGSFPEKDLLQARAYAKGERITLRVKTDSFRKREVKVSRSIHGVGGVVELFKTSFRRSTSHALTLNQAGAWTIRLGGGVTHSEGNVLKLTVKELPEISFVKLAQATPPTPGKLGQRELRVTLKVEGVVGPEGVRVTLSANWLQAPVEKVLTAAGSHDVLLTPDQAASGKLSLAAVGGSLCKIKAGKGESPVYEVIPLPKVSTVKLEQGQQAVTDVALPVRPS
jgi:hypothetical protein